MALQMQHAEERGDRRSARDLARQILAAQRDADASASAAVGAGRPSDGEQSAARLSARELLRRTEPDAFLLVVGLLGLGLTVWLVYNYVL
jgi:hypothetical protein